MAFLLRRHRALHQQARRIGIRLHPDVLDRRGNAVRLIRIARGGKPLEQSVKGLGAQGGMGRLRRHGVFQRLGARGSRPWRRASLRLPAAFAAAIGDAGRASRRQIAGAG